MPARYAIVGTGGRAALYIHAISHTYRAAAELVGLCDVSPTRMNWYNRYLEQSAGLPPRPTYSADDFDRMIAETRPDVVIVTTVDAFHHLYIIRAMQLGCDVITEKPMTTDADKARAILETVAQTGRSLRVTFNYRYAPAFTQVRDVIQRGLIGRPLLVDFSWMLDIRHGADYFRRWHREKHYSGGLLVHKATHHFDLVNWWIASVPETVFAFGRLGFYGRENAAARGEFYPYTRYTGSAEAANDPFALHLDRDAQLRGLYLEAEADSGYLRDRNVFGEPITIEDTMTVTARYRSGALLSYCLVAYSPWEGLRLAITGDRGRLELQVVENTNDPQPQASDAPLKPSTGTFKGASLRLFPMFEPSCEVAIPAAEGGHGGADPLMLAQLFAPEPPPDPYQRAASHRDGAASILLGIAANRAIETGLPVTVSDLLPL